MRILIFLPGDTRDPNNQVIIDSVESIRLVADGHMIKTFGNEEQLYRNLADIMILDMR